MGGGRIVDTTDMEQKMNKIIKIDNLCKSFGDVKAVQNLSFSVKEGELFAFLGVNGAGKSTTINIMCGQLSKDSGTVEINGADLDKDAREVKSSLGIVFQNSVLDGPLSVYVLPITLPISVINSTLNVAAITSSDVKAVAFKAAASPAELLVNNEAVKP